MQNTAAHLMGARKQREGENKTETRYMIHSLKAGPHWLTFSNPTYHPPIIISVYESINDGG